ncbi:MAG TPA: QacE family quaternary ammonium compound efflux SMR transporter, partial [Weissella confusa]|nr:QacE family quaternary ammonium compound efflux SMR transporter [Weissella confusa]
GTVYAIFVGLGTAATIVANWMFYGEAMNAIQLSLIAVLLFGVIGLKLMEDA